MLLALLHRQSESESSTKFDVSDAGEAGFQQQDVNELAYESEQSRASSKQVLCSSLVLQSPTRTDRRFPRSRP